MRYFLWIFYVFLSCICYAFVRVSLYVPCGHLLRKVWPLGLRLWCLSVSMSLSWIWCGTWLYRYLIFAPLLTLIKHFIWFPNKKLTESQVTTNEAVKSLWVTLLTSPLLKSKSKVLYSFQSLRSTVSEKGLIGILHFAITDSMKSTKS